MTECELPPGSWLASDGRWYPATPPPPAATWVRVEQATRCAPCGRHVHDGVRWWDPARGGLHCKPCSARLGVGRPPRPPVQGEAPPTRRREEVRRLRLQREDTCSDCGAATPAGSWAGWDERARVVVCEPCLDRTAVWQAGVPGASAAREAERRREEWRRQAEVIWGAEAVNDTSEDPSTAAFAKGAAGEQRLGRMLEALVAGSGWVLHDRAASRNANIDHIAVVPSGVWIIDSKNYRGKVRVGRHGLFGPVHSMRVRGVDRTDLVLDSKWQVDLVRSAVDDPAVPVHLVLALPNDAAFGWFTKSFQIRGVWCAPPGQLKRRLLDAPPFLRSGEVEQIARRLSARLPPAVAPTGSF